MNNIAEQYLVFETASQRYAIGIGRVRQIVDRRKVTRVPGTSRVVTGVCNLGGVITPVVDTAAKLAQAQPAAGRGCIVIVDARHEQEVVPIGLLVDSVAAVLRVASESIEPPPDFGANVRLQYLRGISRAEGQFLFVLDLDQFLSARELLEITQQKRTADALASRSAN